MADTESSPIAARFAELADTQGLRTALTLRSHDNQVGDLPSHWDFGTFWYRVQQVTDQLQSAWRVGRGERVAWLGLNHAMQLVTLVACARVGAIFVPLNFRLAVAELQQVLADARARLLVHDEMHAETARALQTGSLAITPPDALVTSALPQGRPRPQVHADEPVLLVYTSGTTGMPKGALHTQAGLLANARASQWAHGFVAHDKVLSSLPLFHVGGLCIQTLPALLAGVEVVLHPRFDAGTWLDELAISRPTLSLLVPATLRALFEHPRWADTSLESLRGIMTGSSTVPVTYLQALHARGVPVGQVYGTTETGPVSIVLRLPDAMAREGAAGWPQPEAQVRLIDAQGSAVRPGETGEVCIRAPNVMRGYWNTQGDAGVGLHDGWFHSGDLGRCGDDGCITIVGRCKDLIISGGENIYPAEIENLLVSLPGVAECAVVGLPDARWGEVPVAALVRAPDAAGTRLEAQGVIEHLQQRIARFKLPRQVLFVESLPKSALGKIQKAALQRQLQPRMQTNSPQSPPLRTNP